MRYSFRLLTALCAFALVAGCVLPPEQPGAAFSSLTIGQKHEYIRHAKSTLKIFRTAAADLQNRRKQSILREFSGEFKRYMDVQMEPVVSDFAAGHDLQTRLEVAKLLLLEAQVYIELAEYRQAGQLLATMQQRYGEKADILSATLDRNDIGFSTVGDGLHSLQERIGRENTGFPLLRLFALPRI